MLENQHEENPIDDIGVEYLSSALQQNQVKCFEFSFSFSSSFKDFNYAESFFKSNWRRRYTAFG